MDASDIQGNDDFSGGTSVDFIAVTPGADVSVTLDGLANGGQAGESDNTMPDVEDVVTGAGDYTISAPARRTNSPEAPATARFVAGRVTTALTAALAATPSEVGTEPTRSPGAATSTL